MNMNKTLKKTPRSNITKSTRKKKQYINKLANLVKEKKKNLTKVQSKLKKEEKKAQASELKLAKNLSNVDLLKDKLKIATTELENANEYLIYYKQELQLLQLLQ